VTYPAEQPGDQAPPGGYQAPPPGYPAPPPGYPAPPPGYPAPPGGAPGYGYGYGYGHGYGYGYGYGYPPGGFRPPVPVGPDGAPLAEFWQRLVAYLLDSLVLGAAMLIPLLLVFGLLFVPFLRSNPDGPDPTSLLILELLAFAVVIPLQIVATYVYFVRMFYKTGQTVGKRVMKIRTVRAADGGPIDLRTARRRWLAQYVAATVAWYFNLADGLWQLWDQPYRQCLHDKCAETVVVQVVGR
jgi:uncharacterized RDD family membrane protein YckC